MNDVSKTATAVARLKATLADLDQRRTVLLDKANTLDGESQIGALDRVLSGGTDKVHARRRAESASARAEAVELTDALTDGHRRLIEADADHRTAVAAERLGEAKTAALRAATLETQVVKVLATLNELLAAHKAEFDTMASATGFRHLDATHESFAVSVLRAIADSALPWMGAHGVGVQLVSANLVPASVCASTLAAIGDMAALPGAGEGR